MSQSIARAITAFRNIEIGGYFAIKVGGQDIAYRKFGKAPHLRLHDGNFGEDLTFGPDTAVLFLTEEDAAKLSTDNRFALAVPLDAGQVKALHSGLIMARMALSRLLDDLIDGNHIPLERLNRLKEIHGGLEKLDNLETVVNSRKQFDDASIENARLREDNLHWANHVKVAREERDELIKALAVRVAADKVRKEEFDALAAKLEAIDKSHSLCYNKP